MRRTGLLLLPLTLSLSVCLHEVEAQNSLPLHVASIGAGHVIVVLHGGPGMRHNYLRPEWDHLGEDARVVYYDQRGCGRSTREGPFGWRQHVADLHGIVDAVSPDRSVTLAGSSWGALLAVLFAHSHPDRVEALVLSGVPSWGGLIEGPRAEFGRAAPNLKETWRERVMRAHFPPELHVVRDSAWMVNNSGAPLGDPLSARLGDVCLLPSEITLASLFDAPRLTDLQHIEAPALIAIGDQPDSRGSGAEALAEVLAQGALFHVPHAGHDPWLDQPDIFFAEVSRFLDQVVRAR